MFRYKCKLFRVKIWNDGTVFKQSEQRYLNCSIDFIGQFWKSLTNSDIAFKKLDIYVKGWGKGSKKEIWIRRLSTCRFASQVSATPEAGPDWGLLGSQSWSPTWGSGGRKGIAWAEMCLPVCALIEIWNRVQNCGLSWGLLPCPKMACGI